MGAEVEKRGWSDQLFYAVIPADKPVLGESKDLVPVIQFIMVYSQSGRSGKTGRPSGR